MHVYSYFGILFRAHRTRRVQFTVVETHCSCHSFPVTTLVLLNEHQQHQQRIQQKIFVQLLRFLLTLSQLEPLLQTKMHSSPTNVRRHILYSAIKLVSLPLSYSHWICCELLGAEHPKPTALRLTAIRQSVWFSNKSFLRHFKTYCIY